MKNDNIITSCISLCELYELQMHGNMIIDQALYHNILYYIILYYIILYYIGLNCCVKISKLISDFILYVEKQSDGPGAMGVLFTRISALFLTNR